MSALPMEQEPAGRVVHGPLRWRTKVCFDNRRSPALYPAQTLDGVRWTCPSCGHGESLSLVACRSRGRLARQLTAASGGHEYYCKCVRWSCQFRRTFSFVKAPAVLSELDAPLP